jgi:hypothetical protein
MKKKIINFFFNIVIDLKKGKPCSFLKEKYKKNKIHLKKQKENKQNTNKK